jgi:hypothetical protein
MSTSRAIMAPARPVDLSARTVALWLAATTLLALPVIDFAGIDDALDHGGCGPEEIRDPMEKKAP